MPVSGIAPETHTPTLLGSIHGHRGLTDPLTDGIVGRVSHGTAQLPLSRRYYMTAKPTGEAAYILGFKAPPEFVRAHPMSSEWLTLLIRQMDPVASIYRLAASMSPVTDSLLSLVPILLMSSSMSRAANGVGRVRPLGNVTVSYTYTWACSP